MTCENCADGWIDTTTTRQEEVFLGIWDGAQRVFHHPETGKVVKWQGSGPEWTRKRANPELYEMRAVSTNSVSPCPNCKPAEYDFYQHGALTQGHLAGRSKDVEKDNLTKARERYEVPTTAELYSVD